MIKATCSKVIPKTVRFDDRDLVIIFAAVLTLLMTTATSMLPQRPISGITGALSFLLQLCSSYIYRIPKHKMFKGFHQKKL